MKFTYQIEGMHCATCIEKIKSALSIKLKVIEVTLNPPRLQIEANKTPQLDVLNTYISAAGNYRLQPINNTAYPISNEIEESNGNLWSYYPIFLITIYIAGVASINNFHWERVNWQGWMNQFMAGFFLVFSAFKLLDIRGFADGYATYDLLARRWHSYGFIYPFLELGLGILYLKAGMHITTQVITIIIMGFSSLGVINSLLKKQKLKCACLGTIINVPLSSITLIEDLTMVGLAALTLIIR
jgi:copper chaperone CopZ